MTASTTFIPWGRLSPAFFVVHDLVGRYAPPAWAHWRGRAYLPMSRVL
jgi:hypothetical protein